MCHPFGVAFLPRRSGPQKHHLTPSSRGKTSCLASHPQLLASAASATPSLCRSTGPSSQSCFFSDDMLDANTQIKARRALKKQFLSVLHCEVLNNSHRSPHCTHVLFLLLAAHQSSSPFQNCRFVSTAFRPALFPGSLRILQIARLLLRRPSIASSSSPALFDPNEEFLFLTALVPSQALFSRCSVCLRKLSAHSRPVITWLSVSSSVGTNLLFQMWVRALRKQALLLCCCCRYKSCRSSPTATLLCFSVSSSCRKVIPVVDCGPSSPPTSRTCQRRSFAAICLDRDVEF